MAVAPAAIKPDAPVASRLGALERRNLSWGLLFISPWLFGFIFLGVFPILYTFYLSLTRYSGSGRRSSSGSRTTSAWSPTRSS